MFVITRIGLDEVGRINQVEGGGVDPARNTFVSGPRVVPVAEVLKYLDAGLRVGTVFGVFKPDERPDGAVPKEAAGRTVYVTGPMVRASRQPDGSRGIEDVPAEGETRSLMDLPRIEQ